ncbi:hypothetical protein QBC33DRAFT_525459 [Phialemonium atrogriseum]|uniref:DUF2306 domain-containing protein n=1 Tax=Phialemonium atrogriseum TaxID=1093897 RepID=A0AAJ0FTC7_9PEZI|nr:uncharacterized protein QBC33DRAFT_525459 [Phialemonium atrogriseum]KAK1772020.1 hypothetical protein QBC33DRAFT_525459 [Phialemonium atrogriseum]
MNQQSNDTQAAMVTPGKPPANGFVRAASKVYSTVGFSKGRNFVLWFVFAGALMGFSLARLPYLDFDGVFCGGNPHAAPGECFYFRKYARDRVGIVMHFAAILPAGILVCFQFVPAIRHKFILVHSMNGYVVILLSVVGTVGGLMIARHTFGGGMASQSALGFLSIIFLGALVMAYINIKLLQIDQHRAWMLRAWFYASAIITTRAIQIPAAVIISLQGGHFAARPCDQIADTLGGGANATLRSYPECAAFFSGEDPHRFAAVRANIAGGGNAIEGGVALGMAFGAAMWLAVAMHCIGIEVYLRLTPAEHERLRNVSYERQLAAGMRDPGRAGLTADQLGDSERWVPADRRGY